MTAARCVVKVVAMCSMSWALIGCVTNAGIEESRPLVAVMAGIPRQVVLVDLVTGEKVAEYRVRSMAGGIDVDPELRLVMTAQCGGVSTDADDAIGIYDVGGGGAVDYLKLETPNPGFVFHIAPGSAFVSNGWMDEDGMVVGSIDPRAGTTIKEGRVPDMVSQSFAGGFVWAWCNSIDSDTPTLRQVDPVSLESTVVIEGGSVPLTIVGSRAPGGPMFALTPIDGGRKDSPVRIQRFDGTEASLQAEGRIIEFRDGPQVGGAVIGDVLAIPDFSNVDADDNGTRVWLMSTDLDSEPVEVSIPGGPAGIAVWGSKFVVVESDTGRILSIDPKTAQTEVIADLDGHEGWYDGIAVLP